MVAVLALPSAAPAPAADDCGDGLAAARPGAPVLLPVAASHDTPLGQCGGIRPGGALVIRAGPLEFLYCSMAFLVTDGTDLYVTTAGHCVEPDLGAPGVGERVAAHGVPGTFGTVVYQWCEGRAANGGCGAGTDFGIIRIDDDKRAYADPAMCRWGAATGGVFTARDADLREIHHFGWGVGIGDPGGAVGAPVGNPATQARAGLGLDFTEPTLAIVETAAISGDSGSGVLVGDLDGNVLAPDTGAQALGVMTHISVGGIAVVQRLDASLAKAGSDLGKTFTLVTQ